MVRGKQQQQRKQSSSLIIVQPASRDSEQMGAPEFGGAAAAGEPVERSVGCGRRGEAGGKIYVEETSGDGRELEQQQQQQGRRLGRPLLLVPLLPPPAAVLLPLIDANHFIHSAAAEGGARRGKNE
jgi:hypothetical protein